MNRLALAVCVVLLSAAPGWAGTLQIWEDSLGSPGATAQFPNGTGLVADLYFDASSAEGGAGLPFGGPSEIDIRPTGNVIFVDFTCLLAGCNADPDFPDYDFEPGFAGNPGDPGVGFLLLSDPNAGAASGIYHIGLLEFDIAAGLGGIDLEGCNYTTAGPAERHCDPFTLVNVPEPASGALVGLALGALAVLRRRR